MIKFPVPEEVVTSMDMEVVPSYLNALKLWKGEKIQEVVMTLAFNQTFLNWFKDNNIELNVQGKFIIFEKSEHALLYKLSWC